MSDKRRILLCLNHMSGRELDFINKAFDGNWVVPLGPDVDAFEEDLRRYYSPDPDNRSLKDSGMQVVALSSGTAAIHLALDAAGVGPGDEVICQSMTFCASCNPVKYLGASPVFVDSEPETWNIDPDLLERAISERTVITGHKPKAIVAVHLYGMPAKIDLIADIARRHGITLIEDAAEAMGSRYAGQLCGTFGRFGIVSFNGNKMITTSGGGALICPDRPSRDMVMKLATQAREPYPFYQHERIGYNYRLSNISAAIGRGQMTILDDHLAHHRRLASLYAELLDDVPGITFHHNPSPESDSNFWLSAITIDPSIRVAGQSQVCSGTTVTDCPNPNVEALRQILAAEGIESRPLWKPMHLQPVYADAPAYINGVSQQLFQTGLCLPSGPCVSPDDVRLIVSLITQSLS